MRFEESNGTWYWDLTAINPILIIDLANCWSLWWFDQSRKVTEPNPRISPFWFYHIRSEPWQQFPEGLPSSMNSLLQFLPTSYHVLGSELQALPMNFQQIASYRSRDGGLKDLIIIDEMTRDLNFQLESRYNSNVWYFWYDCKPI